MRPQNAISDNLIFEILCGGVCTQTLLLPRSVFAASKLLNLKSGYHLWTDTICPPKIIPKSNVANSNLICIYICIYHYFTLN